MPRSLPNYNIDVLTSQIEDLPSKLDGCMTPATLYILTVHGPEKITNHLLC